jgi:hypothetical protein
LDDNKFIAAILMDLSKAFDCLPHNLLMLKLEAYGLSENSLKLLKSYLENRRQRIKIGNNYSEWDTIKFLENQSIKFMLSVLTTVSILVSE